MERDIILFILYLIVLIGLGLPLGSYIAKVFTGKKTVLDPVFLPLEKLVIQLTGASQDEMGWKKYAFAALLFNIFGAIVVFAIQIAQAYLPFNPQNFSGVTPELAFNTAISFITNTNWQAYSGETTMSYFTQMAAFTVQNFLSAATGMAVVIAFIRGLVRKTTKTIGNFWHDLVKGTLWVLLPLSIILSLLFVQQGVIQNLSSYVSVTTIDGTAQTLAMGPVATQEAIKMLGTNGGGFFNANSAHPFENPTAWTNFLQMVAIFLIPTALVFAFGLMCGNRRQGYAVYGAMLILFVIFTSFVYVSEYYGNPQLTQLGVSAPNSMEGKEVRFGIGGTSLFATITTAAACGAVNAVHDSLTPVGGLLPMLQMMLGEVVIGGVGSGFYGIMVFVILTVFIVGLMVGRTPEYLGKKIEAWEMKMAVLAVLIPAAVILLGSALSTVVESAYTAIANEGPHGLSEMLYAWASAAGNNGSAFAGLNSNIPFYNIGLGLAMFIGRFGIIFPVLAIAGSLAEKKAVPQGAGTFKTTGPLFIVLLAGVVVNVGALTFLPALALGPIVEQLLMVGGTTF